MFIWQIWQWIRLFTVLLFLISSTLFTLALSRITLSIYSLQGILSFGSLSQIILHDFLSQLFTQGENIVKKYVCFIKILSLPFFLTITKGSFAYVPMTLSSTFYLLFSSVQTILTQLNESWGCGWERVSVLERGFSFTCKVAAILFCSKIFFFALCLDRFDCYSYRLN